MKFAIVKNTLDTDGKLTKATYDHDTYKEAEAAFYTEAGKILKDDKIVSGYVTCLDPDGTQHLIKTKEA